MIECTEKGYYKLVAERNELWQLLYDLRYCGIGYPDNVEPLLVKVDTALEDIVPAGNDHGEH
jgi:hypothetical protein